MQETKLGQLLGPDEGQRDAVHVAVVPLVANHSLEPGDNIGLFPDGTAGFTYPHVGIVDPFLVRGNGPKPGQKFYGVLYPGTITSLRHVWTSPHFPVRPPVARKEVL